ncbi:glycosyltransferase [Tannockella kyphosi]|uniref:glycosyltransferase n=1 Tax=Tannockella kyphosi TaxID=2899121 RepID=UPI002012E3F5|nr:glycosyltransferase [Tannockella kyphosi]
MNLVFITKFYPFGLGETFIENEIKIMSNYYDKILIISCDVQDCDKIIRPLPKNVEAIKLSGMSRFDKAKSVIKGSKYIISSDESIMYEMQDCRNILQKIFVGYFEQKNQHLSAQIIDSKLLRDFCDNDFILYSYWFFSTAKLGVEINNKYNSLFFFSRAHRYDLYEERSLIKRLPFRNLLLEECDNVLPCSENGTSYLKKKYPNFSNKIMTSLLGTLDYGIAPYSADGKFRIVSCSRVESVKRLDKLVLALELLQNEYTNIEWVHIGDGTKYNKVYNLAKKRLKNIKVSFFGALSNSDVLEFYKNNPIDLFVNVSSSEGLPVSIMEAISFGIPALATDVGGTSEIVIDNVTGKLMRDDFKNEDLFDGIKYFILSENKETKIQLRESCRNYWKENFQAEKNYNLLHTYLIKEE